VQDFYFQLLWVAVAAAVAALLLALAVRMGIRRARLVQWTPLAAGIALLALAAAAASHLLLGHGHESAEPLDPLSFLQAHPVLIVIALIALLALGIGRTGGRR
jgi:hypothetical protein